VPVHEAPPQITPSSLNTVTSLVSQWGGAVALGVFALWALWMLRSMGGSRPAVGELPTEASIDVPAPAGGSAAAVSAPGLPAPKKEKEEPMIEEEPLVLNDRDLVQTMVRDNPEMAVAIIGKWLQGAR
jgi:hypothetical protein